MAKGGAFTDGDTSEVEEFIERKLLRRGVLGRFSRVDGVSIRPVVSGLEGLGRKERKARRQEVPGTWIGRARSIRRSVPVHVRPPGPPGSEDGVPSRLAAAGVSAPDARMSLGQCIFDFPRDAAAADFVRFSLDAMRALGAEPADGRWEWAGTIEIDTTGPAGS
ncbi:MAG TPA: hypothetical protein VGO28_10080 [Acidimicrobiia bacterium]